MYFGEEAATEFVKRIKELVDIALDKTKKDINENIISEIEIDDLFEEVQ